MRASSYALLLYQRYFRLGPLQKAKVELSYMISQQMIDCMISLALLAGFAVIGWRRGDVIPAAPVAVRHTPKL